MWVFLFCGSFKWPNFANNLDNSQTVLLLDNERQCRCSIHYDARYVTEINRISLRISAVHPWPKLKKLSSDSTNTNYLYSSLSIGLFIFLNVYYCCFFKAFWIFKGQKSWENIITVLRKFLILDVASFVTLVKKPSELNIILWVYFYANLIFALPIAHENYYTLPNCRTSYHEHIKVSRYCST